jgi:GTP cyclohydrolase II
VVAEDERDVLGLPEDARDYTAAAQMLTALGVTAINLLSNNPDKARQLARLGITVRRTVPTGVYATPSNLRYLNAKVDARPHPGPEKQQRGKPEAAGRART